MDRPKVHAHDSKKELPMKTDTTTSRKFFSCNAVELMFEIEQIFFWEIMRKLIMANSKKKSNSIKPFRWSIGEKSIVIIR